MKMEYLFTERAHLACPNMCFGIAASLGKIECKNLRSSEQLKIYPA